MAFQIRIPSLITSRNKKILGMNVAAPTPYFGPFYVNRIHQCGDWNNVPKAHKDQYGELSGTPSSPITAKQFLFKQNDGIAGYDLAGEWNIEWDDGPTDLAATDNLPGIAQVGDRHYTFTMPSTVSTSNRAFYIEHSASYPTPARNFRVYRTSDAAALGNGDGFVPELIDFLGNFAGLRAMNLQNSNGTWPIRVDSAPYKDWSPLGVAQLVELANTCGIDLWIVVNVASTDDEISAAADQIAANLDPGCDLYVEYMNEPWNEGFGPSKMGKRLGKDIFSTTDGTDGLRNFHGVGLVRTAYLFDQAMRGYRSNYKILFGGQSNNGSKAGLTANLWRAIDPGNHVAPVEVVDGVCIAPYYAKSMGKRDDIWPVLRDSGQAAAEAFMGGAAMDTYLVSVQDDTIGWKQYCDPKGLELHAYENGYHGVLGTTDVSHSETLDFYAGVMPDPSAYQVGEWVVQATTGAHAQIHAIDATTIYLDTLPLADDLASQTGSSSVPFNRAQPYALVGQSSGANQVPIVKNGKYLQTPSKDGVVDLFNDFAYSAPNAAAYAAHLDNCLALGLGYNYLFASYGGATVAGAWGLVSHWGDDNYRKQAVDDWGDNNPRPFLNDHLRRSVNYPDGFATLFYPTCEPQLPDDPTVGEEYLPTLDGRWSNETGAAVKTWQWRADGVPISGATAYSYTPVAGDVGKSLSLTTSIVDGARSGSVTSQSKVVKAG